MQLNTDAPWFCLIKSALVAAIMFITAYPFAEAAAHSLNPAPWCGTYDGYEDDMRARETAVSDTAVVITLFLAIVSFGFSISGIMEFEFERFFWSMLFLLGAFPVLLWFVSSLMEGAVLSPHSSYGWAYGLSFLVCLASWAIPVKDKLVLRAPGRSRSGGGPLVQ